MCNISPFLTSNMIWMKLITIILLYGKAKGRWLSNKQFYLELWDEQYCFARLLQHSANIGENIFVFTKSIYYYIIKESAKSLTRPFIFHW